MTTTVTRQVRFAVEGKRKRVVGEPEPPIEESQGRVPRISKLMALAIRYEQMLNDGVVQSQTELAELLQISQPRMTQIMNLLHLAPGIQEEILFLAEVGEGRDPISERELRVGSSAILWTDQISLYRLIVGR